MKRPLSSTDARASFTLRTLCAAAGCLAAAAAYAEETPAAPAPAATPAPSSTENLVRLMVDKSVITREQGEAIVAQARMEAAKAEIAKSAATPPAPAGATAPKDGVVRVQYVPEAVKQQLREDIKQELEAEAKADGWAKPGTVPEWVSRFHPNGDLRFRFDGRFYPGGNDLTGSRPNFNAINTGAPYDVSASNPNFAPQLNADQERDRVRFRARFGAEIDLDEGFTSGVRLATGDTASPVTQNQTFGQSGGFSKYAVWIDRAFLKWQPSAGPDTGISLTVGRFDNPFFHTSQMVWADDLGFDGIAANIVLNKTGSITPFFTAGAFPVGATALDFSSLQPDKAPSEDKWLYAAQLGTTVKVVKDFSFKVAGAYYHFDNVSGRLSTPYTPLSAFDEGDTDQTRPGYAQNGNSYMPLRNIIPDASNGFGTTNQFQYFGLAPEYHVVAITTRADLAAFDPFHVSLDGEVIKNVAFDRGRVSALSVNNRAGGTATGSFEGGDFGWEVNLNVGTPALENAGDWLLGVGYRHQESDSTVDGFNDNDFGNGGTNLEGFTLTGSLAVSKRVSLRARWMSAESIAGPQFKADTFQFDITARF